MLINHGGTKKIIFRGIFHEFVSYLKKISYSLKIAIIVIKNRQFHNSQCVTSSMITALNIDPWELPSVQDDLGTTLNWERL